MKKIKFYVRIALPNVMFFAVYLFFLFNKDIFFRASEESAWTAYTIFVFTLIGLNIYLNRLHRHLIMYTDRATLMQRLDKMFVQQGFYRRLGSFGERVYDKSFMISSFLTPPVRVQIQQGHVVLVGPKAKIDEVLDAFETMPASEAEANWPIRTKQPSSLA